MLTHAAFVAEIAGFENFLSSIGETLSSDDVFLSYLPLAHSFDRCALNISARILLI